jgi:glycosyltransferase involved in cell wall biosynthesis
MKIHIIFSFKNGPYGGGNQFLKALRAQFIENEAYAERPEEADVFLFNSFQDIRPTLTFKRKFPGKPFVHRVDGPISLYRNSQSPAVDRTIFSVNDTIADATVFQSRFSLETNRLLGMKESRFEAIIYNAPDNSVFFPDTQDKPLSKPYRKTRLISTSWSSNPMKGFDVYRHLDEHLDFDRYEYLFVGNTPVPFRNIQVLPAQTSQKLAELLRSSDIYITASRKDPCSNSLIEAIACGLPAIALNDGGHPELVGKGGELFEKAEEIPAKLRQIEERYRKYQAAAPRFQIQEAARQYISFLENVCESRKEGVFVPKQLSLPDRLIISLQSILTR